MTRPEIGHADGVAGLKKVHMKTRTVVAMIYCLVAAGAFGIEEMVSESGPGIALTMLIIFLIIWAWPISNLVAEAGSLLPSEGGVYVWARDAFGEFWGFQAGWWNTVSIYITNGIYAALVVGYTAQFVDMTPATQFMLKIAMILVFTIINLLGIREVGAVSTAFSIAIMVAFALVALVGFLNWNGNPFDPYFADWGGGDVLSPSEAIGGCLAICIWMYCGYECISTLAGEVKNPQVIPKGLLIAMPLIALTYILPTMGGLASIGQWADWSTDGTVGSVGYYAVLADNLGQVWGYAFLFIAIISQCAIFNTYLASGSRGFFVLADDNLCPKFLVKVSKKRGVPYVGVISLALVTALLAQYDFTTLVMAEVVFILALYVIMPLSVVKLRKLAPIEDRLKHNLFVMPGGKYGIYFFAGIVLVISIVALMINGTDYFLIGIIGCSSGPLVYVICKWRYGGITKRDPENFPMNPKTKLAFGDTYHLAVYGLVAGFFSVVGSFVLAWWEGEWGEEYYAEEGESTFWIFDDYYAMLDMLRWVGIGLMAFGVIMLIVGKFTDKRNPMTKLVDEENLNM